MKKLVNGSRNIGAFLLVLCFLLPVSLSADDFQSELTEILKDFDSTLLSLESNWQQQGESLTNLSESMESLKLNQSSLEQTLNRQREQYDYLSNIMQMQETTLKDLEQSATDLQHSLHDTQRALERTRTINRIMAGGLAVSLLLAGISLLF